MHHDDIASAVALAVTERLDDVFNVAPDGSILTEIRPTREERERFRLDFYATRVHLVQNWFNEVRQIGEE